MAKLSIIARNSKRKNLVQKYQQVRNDLKVITHEFYVRGEIPWEALHKIQLLPRNSSPTRLLSRCRLCGRPHAVYKKFGMCRLCLRKHAMQGYIPGLTKASW